jgi:hypothetical protein
MTDVQTRKEVESWIQYALIPVVERLEALEARLPKEAEKQEDASANRLTSAPLDPETPECSICGARVFDPCRTLERAKYCQLPPGTAKSPQVPTGDA